MPKPQLEALPCSTHARFVAKGGSLPNLPCFPSPAVVSKAFSCLSDPDKRRSYDTYGAEEPPGLGMRGGGGGGGFGGRGGGMYGDVDPEEIFNMFFGGNPFMNPRWVGEALGGALHFLEAFSNWRSNITQT